VFAVIAEPDPNNTAERKQSQTMQEIIMTGKTVEEAVEAACAALGILRDEGSVEVLEMPQKRLFGSIPAKVRVYVSDDAFSVKDLLKSQDEQPEKEVSVNDSADGQKKQPADKPKIQETAQKQPEKEIKTIAETPVSAPVAERTEKEIPFEALPRPAQAAFNYLKAVAQGMKADRLTFKAVELEGGVKFCVDGEDAAILIGRRGETMDALQYLCLLVSNREEGEYCKISIDVAGYRVRREHALQSLAGRVASKVLKSRRRQTLEPMNPYERRIVHSAIQEINGVSSESVGDDPHRRVVVFLDGDKPRSSYRGRDDRGSQGQFERDRRNSRPKRDDSNRARPQQKPAPPKPQDPELEKNLYGKIEL